MNEETRKIIKVLQESKNAKVIDAEYHIKLDNNKTDSMIMGVTSVGLNASCWVRITDNYLKDCTVKKILTDLFTMESSMVHQKNKGLLISNKPK